MKMKKVKEFTQKIFSFININSSNTQVINNNTNKEFIAYVLEKEFKSIDVFLDRGDLKSAEELLENISLRKEKFSNNDELKLLEYRGLIAILKGEIEKVSLYQRRMKDYENYDEYEECLILNCAIHKRDFLIFSKLKEGWKIRGVEEELIIQNEVLFMFHLQEYKKVIEIFNLNKKFLNSDDMLFLIGEAYVNLGYNREAKEVFIKSVEDSDRKKLWLLISEVREILSLCNTLDEFRERKNIQEFIDRFSQINKANLCFNDEKNLVLIATRMKLFVNLDECLNSVLILKKNYNFIELDILYLDVLEQLNKIQESERVYDELRAMGQEDKELIARGILIKYNLEKYDEVKALYEKFIDFYEGMNEITYYYGIALIKLIGIHEAKLKISTRISKDNKFDLLLLSELYSENKDQQEEYLIKLKEKITVTSYFNIYIADIYYKADRLEEAFKILVEGSKVNKVLFKRLLSLASRKDINSSENIEVMKIYNKHYKNEKDSYICEYIYGMLVEGKRYIQAKSLAKKMYEAKKSLYWTNNYLEMKIANEELDGIYDLIQSLQGSCEGRYIINVALGYMKINSYHLCKELCFKAYSRMKVDEKIILLKIGMIGLEIGQILDKEKRMEIENEVIVTLGDIKGKVERYCITSEVFSLYNSEIQGDIIICSFKDDIAMEVLGKQKGDKITVNENEFTIIEKIDKYAYMFREGISHLLEQEECNTKKIIIKEENGEVNIQGLIDDMKLRQEAQKKVIKLYLNGEIPFFLLCENRERIPSWIKGLSVEEEYGIVAGVNSNLIGLEESITLSLSSIFILYFKGLLDFYVKKFNVIVGSNLMKELNTRIETLTKTLMIKNMSMFLVDERISMHEQTLEDKKSVMKMYKTIVKCLEKATIVNVELMNNELLLGGEGFIPISDIECIEIAKEYKATLILEDYFLSKGALSIDLNMKLGSIANTSISIIINNDNVAKNIEVLKELIKERYRFVFTEKTLEKFIFSFELTDKWRHKKFKEIVDLLLNYDFEDKFYARQLLAVNNKVLGKNPTDVKGRIIRDSIWKKYLKLLMKDQLVVNE